MGTNGGAVYLSGIGSNATFIECAFVNNEVHNQSKTVFVSLLSDKYACKDTKI